MEAVNHGNAARVLYAGDGDTLTVRLSGVTEKVRMIGIDAPEMGQRPWGKRAKAHLDALLRAADGEVVLEYDVDERDRHGRLLAYVWSRDRKTMLNEAMVAGGYAMLYTLAPNVRYAQRFASAQLTARRERRGIWGNGGLTKRPAQYRRENPGR